MFRGLQRSGRQIVPLWVIKGSPAARETRRSGESLEGFEFDSGSPPANSLIF
jgi:hypothetical protein